VYRTNLLLLLCLQRTVWLSSLRHHFLSLAQIILILQDLEKFIEDGGWEFLNMEASDSKSDKSEESD
jgi:hypothetical protein